MSRSRPVSPPKIKVLRRGSFFELAEDALAMFEQVNGRPARPEKTRAFLDRIIVNYVRHEMTNYESLKWEARKTGGEAAVTALKVAVLEAIAKAHPPLTDECIRQAKLAGETEW